MDTIAVSSRLVIEIDAGQARLVIKSPAAETGGHAGQVSVARSEIAALREALDRAAAYLAPPPDEQDEAEISLKEAARLFDLDHGLLAEAAQRGELAARRSGLSWLTTRWAVRQALSAGRLRPR
jgi:hypothetical protein